jgi:uncharacterized YigZ family protein
MNDSNNIKDYIKTLKVEYPKATHYCYAYIINGIAHSTDDGEPSGTAGVPILKVLQASGIDNAMLTVIRYFGGIKLGIPGLIRAYKTSTADALANAEIVEKIASKLYRVHFGYMNMNSVMKVFKDMDLVQKNQSFDMECSMDTSVRLSLVDTFLERMADVEGCRVEEI